MPQLRAGAGEGGRPELETIAGTNRLVLGTIAGALAGIATGAQPAGISDLAVNGRKFSGNAQRRRKRFVLFHGTLLHGMNLGLIARYLREPAKQPDYRTKRSHGQFVDNLHADVATLRSALVGPWQAPPSGPSMASRCRPVIG